jgi:hypothetical protein
MQSQAQFKLEIVSLVEDMEQVSQALQTLVELHLFQTYLEVLVEQTEVGMEGMGKV